jgi:hypothetical protein
MEEGMPSRNALETSARRYPGNTKTNTATTDTTTTTTTDTDTATATATTKVKVDARVEKRAKALAMMARLSALRQRQWCTACRSAGKPAHKPAQACADCVCGQMVRVWEKDVAYVGEVVSLQCALDPYDVGVTILYAEGAINERLASFDWELVDV